MTTEEKIKDIIADIYDVDIERVTPMASLVEDLGGDSINLIELIISLEEDLDIEIPDEEAEKFITVKDIIDYCNMKKAN